jgi:hypothetical protein
MLRVPLARRHSRARACAARGSHRWRRRRRSRLVVRAPPRSGRRLPVFATVSSGTLVAPSASSLGMVGARSRRIAADSPRPRARRGTRGTRTS